MRKGKAKRAGKTLLRKAAAPPRSAKNRHGKFSASESDRLLQLVMDLVPHHIFAKDRRGRYLFLNRAAAASVGRQPEEMVGRKELEFSCDQTCTKAFLKDDREVIASGRPKFIPEERIVCSDGQVHFLQTTKIPFKPPGSAKVGVLGVAVDITERKRAEAALLEKEEMFRAMFEVASVGMAQADPTTGRFLLVNRRMCEITGYSDAELLRLRVPDITHPEDRARDWALFQRVVRGEAPNYRLEKRYVRKDGTTAWVNVNMALIRDAAGQPVRTMATIEDISERKLAEAALRESEERYRLLADNVEDFVTVLDTHENRLYISPSCYRVTGWKPEEVMGTPWDARLHPEDIPLIKQSRAANRAGQSTLTEHRIRCRDGSWMWVEARCKPLLGPTGEVTQLLIWQHDVTARRRVEENLRQSREQLRALAAHLQTLREEQSVLIAREIHDELGQAMTAMKLDLTWLQKRLSSSPALHEKVSAIAKHIDVLIEAMQRICSELRPSMLDDLGLVSAFESYSEQFEQRTGLHCGLELPTEDFTLDPARTTAVFRIFQEALTNIARHARATQVRVCLRTAGHGLQLEITDNGRGITPAELTSPKSFGLVGMRERVLALGGHINIRGVAGHGTTVTVTIPTADTP
jgi:PAS domain S-box-containing protein